MSLPAADDLFRPTSPEAPSAAPSISVAPEQQEQPEPSEPEESAARKPSGRVRHDEKMTVYITSDELLDIEHARLMMRRQGLAVDRGRLVREAVALALADYEENGTDSAIVQRLNES